MTAQDWDLGCARFSRDAGDQVRQAFRALFSPVMRVVMHVDGGAGDLETEVQTTLTPAEWKSSPADFEPPGDMSGDLVGLTIYNADGCAVAGFSPSSPAPLASLPQDDGRFGFEPFVLRLEGPAFDYVSVPDGSRALARPASSSLSALLAAGRRGKRSSRSRRPPRRPGRR